MLKILIVEDEPSISNLIQMNLSQAGYFCTTADNGGTAADLLEEDQFDLILLDIMLPEIDGYELMEYIRPLGIPVIFLTAKSSTEDKVKGLRMGADDYLAKPFELAELQARVESVLRRYQKNQQFFVLEDVEIDDSSHLVRKGGKIVELTNKEYDLLLLLVRNRNIALFRETIYERVWGGFYLGDTRTVDLHIQRLRKKLHWEHKIKSIYKVGYRLEDKK